MSVYSKLQSLLTAANTVTGESDVTLTDGVQHLKNGFMQRIVYFYDYDGTLLSSQHIASIEAMPTPPAHEGLTFVRWSQTLDAIQASQDDTYAYAVFRPSDGKTRIYMSFTSSTTNPTLYFSQDKSNGVEIDWGDGSQPERVSGSGVVTVTHTYSSQGSYMITLAPDSDCTWSPGSGTTNTNNSFVSNAARAAVTSVELGDGVTTIPRYCFHGFSGMTSVLMPSELEQTSIGDYVFFGCAGLTSITIPDSVTSIGESAFYSSGLTSITIPDSVTSIGDYVCRGCTGLTSITIPDSVPSIGAYEFSGCRNYDSAFSAKAGTYGDRAFNSCSSVPSFTLGGISSPVTSITNTAFSGCTQTCDITIYTMPQYVTTLIDNTRNGAINATIIIKAASDTVYEGVAYSAGETMVTSNPTV